MRAAVIKETDEADARHGGDIVPKTPNYFSGKTIIITGAASGIGRATANIFSREGANVVCADINETGAKETASRDRSVHSNAR